MITRVLYLQRCSSIRTGRTFTYGRWQVHVNDDVRGWQPEFTSKEP